MKDAYKIKVYLAKDTFEEIAVLDEEYPNLNRLFKESAVFVLDMTDEELDKSLEDSESDFAIFCNSHNLKTTAEESVLQNLKANKDELVRHCRSLFLMDVTEVEAEKIREETGVLVMSKQNIDDNIFNRGYWRHRFVKDVAIKGNAITEWIDVLKNMPWLPTNSLVITDDYLFSESSVSIADCTENVKGLLDAILPQNLSVDFHILISCSHPNCDEQSRNRIVGDIKAYIKSKRNYDIKIEFVFHGAIHQRKVITNYNVMVGDKGFVNFNNKKKKIIADNPTYACTVFQNITDSIGDTEYGMATANLETISKISDAVKLMNNDGVNDHTKRIVGDCNSDKSINNRLLNARF